MVAVNSLEGILTDNSLPKELIAIAQKVQNQERITEEEGLYLYEHADLGFVGTLANHIRVRKTWRQNLFQ